MVPDADLQLTVVIKALREVVASAVDPADRPAIEQLHLSIATLGLIQSRLPLARRRARRELLNALDLADNVRSAAPTASLDDSMEAARAALDDAGADDAALDRLRASLLSAVEAAIEAASGGGAEQAVARAVVAGSRSQCDLARAWCLPAGFEVEADALPPLDRLLSE